MVNGDFGTMNEKNHRKKYLFLGNAVKNMPCFASTYLNHYHPNIHYTTATMATSTGRTGQTDGR